MVRYEWSVDSEGFDAESLREDLRKEREEGISGYYDLPVDAVEISRRAADDAREIESENGYDTIAVIGIGGSSLGARAIYGLLRHVSPDSREMVFLDNPDPMEITSRFSLIDRDRTVFVLVSKSGTTIETITIFKTLVEHFGIDAGSGDSRRIVVVTDAGSALDDFAKHHDLIRYAVPSNVGGRFSVLSAVGVVPLQFAGFDTLSILRGAGAFLERFFDGGETHLLQKAFFYASRRLDHPMNILFAYGTVMEDLTKWYVQLWGESLGKRSRSGERVGLTPLGQIGSLDQHSFLQLLMDGPRDKTVTFMKIVDFGDMPRIPNISLKGIESCDFVNGHSFAELINSQCDATMSSVREQGIPVDLISMDRVSEANIGEIVMYYQILTSAVGILLDIDTYSQPGVERGKKILTEIFGR